jgi:threonine aldolase
MSTRIVDLRSDTITQPTPAMRRAMADAQVGDDVFGEDPTVNQLEQLGAELLGKEAGLFVASGTMGNIISLLVHCVRGEELILGDQSHTFFYEQGGSAGLGGIHPRTVPNRFDGTMGLDSIEAAIRPEDIHFPRTRLISLENTHTRCYGSPLDVNYMRAVGEIARRYGVKVHVDGARIFNAAVALGVEARDLVSETDSVAFCLSKGLGAPAGSVVCGSRDFIAEARRVRKMLGGGMRQVGILAAAGIVALTQMLDRLADDHANARKLSEGLANIEGLAIDPTRVKTNIVYFEVRRRDTTPQLLLEQLSKTGVRLLATGPNQLRAVTHYHVTSDEIEYALGVFRELLG